MLHGMINGFGGLFPGDGTQGIEICEKTLWLP